MAKTTTDTEVDDRSASGATLAVRRVDPAPRHDGRQGLTRSASTGAGRLRGPARVGDGAAAGRSAAIAEELERQHASQAELDRERRSAEEALAEAEVRHSVGEYSEDEWRRHSEQSKRGIEQLRARLRAIGSEITRLTEIQALISGTRATAAPAPPPSPPAPRPAPQARGCRAGAPGDSRGRRAGAFPAGAKAAPARARRKPGGRDGLPQVGVGRRAIPDREPPDQQSGDTFRHHNHHSAA